MPLAIVFLKFNPLMGTAKLHSNGPLYSNTVIGTLAVDGHAVTFGTVRRAWVDCSATQSLITVPNVTAHPFTHQQPVYPLHIIRCGTIITFAL